MLQLAQDPACALLGVRLISFQLMNILLLTSVAGNGGSSATLFHNAKILAQSGCEPIFFAPGDYWKSRGAEENVNVSNALELRRGFRPVSFLRDFLKLRRIISDQKIDAIIVQKSPDPISPTSWQQASVVTKSKTTVSGLTSGTKYWFRVAAVGTAGQGPWSDPATKLAP